MTCLADVGMFRVLFMRRTRRSDQPLIVTRGRSSVEFPGLTVR